VSQRGNGYFAPTVTCRGIKCAPERAEVRHARRGTPDTLQCMSSAPPDIKAGQKSELQRSEPNGFGDVAGAPDMSGVHRTVRCNCGATATSAPTATCSALIARQRTQKSGTPMLAHRTLYSTCPMRHRTSRRAQETELQRSEPNGFGDVAGAPDMSGVHRTVRCTMRQTAPPNG
jgi:hypothetical protein